MEKITKIIILTVILSSFFTFSFSSHTAFAGPYDYTQLEKIPGSESAGSDLGSFIGSIYKFAIWTVGIAAVFMITIGGFMYLTSAGNNSKAESAKKVITDAIIGLIVALSAYLILYVINPDLIKINVSMKQIGTAGGGTTVPKGDGTTCESACANNQVCKESKCVDKPQDTSVGCGKVVDAAVIKKNSGCTYSQPKRNGCNGSPAYTDCSDLVNTSYQKAGCSSPGGNTAAIYANSKPIGDKSSLKAGDLIVRQGHVVMCKYDGCNTIIHAPGTAKVYLEEKSSSYYLNSNWGGQVVRASDYCKSC